MSLLSGGHWDTEEAMGVWDGLNIWVPPKIHMLKLAPHSDSIGKWGLWEVMRS